MADTHFIKTSVEPVVLKHLEGRFGQPFSKKSAKTLPISAWPDGWGARETSKYPEKDPTRARK